MKKIYVQVLQERRPYTEVKVSFLFNESKKLKDEDEIKMAKIYFLENFLIGKQFTTRCDLEYIKLLDDEKQFDVFPWEMIGYNDLIDSIKKIYKKPFCPSCWNL